MQINSIAPSIKNIVTKNSTRAANAIKNGVSTLGKKIGNDKFHTSINKFVEGEGANFGHNAFLVLISVFTLIPRLMHARDDDEKRETIFRDIPTILIICFGMKGIGGMLSSLAAKKSGLHLVDNKNPEGANVFRKALGYFKEKNGASALAGDQVKGLYTQIPNKDVLVNTLECINKHNGRLGEALTMDKASKEGGVLTKAIKELLPDVDFQKAANKEIIDAVKKSNNNEALQKVLDVFKDNKTSPLAKFADVLGASFNTLSSFLIMLALGFGIPKMNEKMTDSIHKKRNAKQPNPTYNSPGPGFYNPKKMLSEEQQKAFQRFLNN